jgi:hypothetical protein
MKKKALTFRIFQSLSDKHYYWWAAHRNGTMLCKSCGFTRRSRCLESLNNFISLTQTEDFEIT